MPKQNYNLFKNKGFTLVELLVVIAIISLLASVVLANVNSIRAKARDTRRVIDATNIKKALDMYYLDKGSYPSSGGATSPNGSWSNSADASWTSLETLLASYFTKLPKDPLENNNPAEWGAIGYHYSYYRCGSTPSYMLVYKLEIAAGPDPGVYCSPNFYRYGGTGPNTQVKTTFR